MLRPASEQEGMSFLGGFTAQEEAPFAALSVHDSLSPSLEAQASVLSAIQGRAAAFPCVREQRAISGQAYCPAVSRRCFRWPAL